MRGANTTKGDLSDHSKEYFMQERKAERPISAKHTHTYWEKTGGKKKNRFVQFTEQNKVGQAGPLILYHTEILQNWASNFIRNPPSNLYVISPQQKTVLNVCLTSTIRLIFVSLSPKNCPLANFGLWPLPPSLPTKARNSSKQLPYTHTHIATWTRWYKLPPRNLTEAPFDLPREKSYLCS